jgi:hypothetical protein
LGAFFTWQFDKKTSRGVGALIADVSRIETAVREKAGGLLAGNCALAEILLADG